MPESNVKLHIAACSEVVRGKMGAEVDIMVYTNKDLNTSEDTTVKDMVLTSWQGTSLFTSTPEIESRKLFDGGIVLKTPVSTGPDYSAILGNIEIPEGVAPSFLAILPEDMRQEVIEEQRQLTLNRQQLPPKPAAAVGNSSGAMEKVNPEFLAALPPNIQEEVLAQQRMEQLPAKPSHNKDEAGSETESDHDDNNSDSIHGRSSLPKPSTDLELQAAEINKSIKAIQVNQTFLILHHVDFNFLGGNNIF